MMKLSLSVVTPICVRSGENASAVADYIYDPQKRTIYLIDQVKFNRWLMEQGKNTRFLIKDITALVSSRQGTLVHFFNEHGLSPRDFSRATIPVSFPNSITFGNRNLFLPTLTGGKPYIPGSSIKGAIRTALMFDYIKNGDNGGLGHGATPHLQDSRQVYTGSDIFCLPDNKSRYPSENDALRFLQVTDTTPSPLESLRVYALERKGGASSAIPALLLGFHPGTEMTFEVNILPGFEKANIPDYWKKFFRKGEVAILKAIKNYSVTLLRDETDRLKKRSDKPPENQLLYDSYTRILSNTKNNIKQGGAALLRIGFGKTYYFNSIGYFLSDEEKKRYEKNWKRVKSVSEFPITRWMIRTPDNQCLPAGWSLIQEKRI
ncbi:MAG TPA: type III-A CRISPR-associated RAMP protein Csm5 [Candidatus Atribacteria bacterium]|nr:type III-A CRISPR-associated RAMP protein Csm5 [Candidatus Atribacteria bacterium]